MNFRVEQGHDWPSDLLNMCQFGLNLFTGVVTDLEKALDLIMARGKFAFREYISNFNRIIILYIVMPIVFISEFVIKCVTKPPESHYCI